MMKGRNTVLLFALAGVLACGPGTLAPRKSSEPPSSSQSMPVGPGFVLTVPPKKLELPNNNEKKLVSPKVVEGFRGPPTSNDWWSSLIWQNDTHGKNPYSDPMYAHPLTMKARAEGLALGYPTKPEVSAYQYMFRYLPDVLVGLEKLASPDTRVAAYSDWTVTAAWRSGDGELRATFGHGLPFVYLTRKGKARARVAPAHEGANVWQKGGEWLGFDVGDRHYVAYAPTGSEWKPDGDAFVSDLAGKDYFSIAVLPDREPATVDLFRTHAYAFVTGSQVSWKYDAVTAMLRSTFALDSELKEEGHGHAKEPLLTLYPHQWKNALAPTFLPGSYQSPRGEMKLMKGPSFTTEMRFNGVLPVLPNVAHNDRGDLEFFVKQVHWQKDLFPPGLGDKPEKDSYWVGKSMLRVANVLQIAEQIGATDAHKYLLQALENELEDWFDGREPSALYYNDTWKTLIPVPSGFGSTTKLNDHHFHYGYFAIAAAIVARYDPKWAARYKDCIDLVIKDAANWDRGDARFPFLRYMDIYAGHSWANGPAEFEEGNNEESSSEDVNFSAGAVLWGAITGNAAVRDLGIFLYTQQVAAIEQYWWDIDQKVFPKGFGHSAVAMVWGAGGRYDTWWDPNPIFIHGINVVPASGGSLYMGRHPDYVVRNYDEVVRRNKGDPLTWRDLMWMYLALAKPDRALELFENDRYFAPEFGNSMAMTYHWITNLAALGQLDTRVTADAPTYAVFAKGNRRTHVAFNPTDRPLKVTFSDGVAVVAPPRQMAEAAGP
jgi:endoglucanase Acf2